MLGFIKNFTSAFEVRKRTKENWEEAILLGYSLFRNLVKYNGGSVDFDMLNKTGTFRPY